MLHKLGNHAQVLRSVAGMNLWLGWAGLSIAVGVAYFLAAQLALSLLTTAERVAVFWPASGIAVGILIALGARARGPVATGVIAATLAANIMADRSVWSSLAFGLCNAGEALVAMWLLERWFGPVFNLDTLRRVAGFFAAAAVATATAAAGASGAMKLFGPSTVEFLDVWKVWFASDALGVITVAPLLIGVAAAVRDAPSWRELLEGTLAVIVATVMYGIALVLLAGPRSLIAPGVFIFPLLLWMSSRCRPVFAAAALFIIAAATVWTTIHEFGRFGDPSQAIADRVLAAQITMLGTALAALTLAALFAERRRSNEQLRNQEGAFRRLLGALPAAIHTTDTAGRITFYNNAAADLWGVSPELGRAKCSDLGRLYYPDGTLVPVDECPTKVCLTERRAMQGREALFERPDGKRIPIIPYPAPLTDEKGDVVGVVSMKIDITERKRTEARLAEREAQLRLFVEHAPAAIAMFDHEMRYLAVSRRFIVDFCLPPDAQLIGRSHYEMFPEIPQRWRDIHARVLAGEELSNEEDQFTRQDGRTDWTRWSMAPWRGGDGRIGGAVLFVEMRTEQVEAQRALTDSEARFRATFENAAVGVALVGCDGSILRANNSFARMLGYSVEELKTRTFQDLTHPDDLTSNLSVFNKTLVGEADSYCIEKRYVRKDGGIVWASLTVGCVRKLDGSVDYFVSVVVDITERKHAEARLSERKAQLDLAGKIARIGSFIYDHGTKKSQLSPGFAAIYGLPEGALEISPEDWRARVHPDDLPTLDAVVRRAFTNGEREYVLEFRMLRDGQVRWIESRVLVSYNEAGKPLRRIGAQIDVTERKQAEQALGERKIQLALAAKAGLVGTYAYDTDTEIMQISEGYAAIHDFPEGTTEIARSECLSGVHPDDIGRVERSRSEAFGEHRREYNVEYRIIRPGGELRWVETRCFISFSRAGQPHRVVGVSIDITERKRVEEQQRTLLAELDHRVKNALATVSAVVSHTQQGSRTVADFVAALDGRIRSMATTHELLSSHRWQGVSLTELVRRELAPYATADNTEISGPGILLKPEAGQAMAMVLHELATNAAKYGALSTKSGRVSIRWDRHLNGHARPDLVFEWQEIGGPPVVALGKSSYGTSTIRGLIPYEFGGTVDLVPAPEGIRCRLELPVDWLGNDGQPLHIHHGETEKPEFETGHWSEQTDR
jgi:PAS domain S-box-containing protein